MIKRDVLSDIDFYLRISCVCMALAMWALLMREQGFISRSDHGQVSQPG